jgi:hypothetical protein
MNKPRHRRLALVLLAGLAAGLGLQGSMLAQGDDPKGSTTKRGGAPEVASMLMGTYQLKSDNADLKLQVESSGGTAQSGNLLATLSGRFQGQDVSQQGLLHLDNQGDQVLMTLTPRLTQGPEASAKPSGQVSSTEMRAACTLSLHPSGPGWAGTTQDPGNCVKALPLKTQEVGQWQLRLRSDEIRVTDVTSRKMLVFQKVSESGRGSS